MLKKITLLLLSIFFVTLILAKDKNLTVGWEPWNPYQFVNKDNELVGLDIEIVKAVADHAGYRLNFSNIPWKRQLIQVEEGITDMALGASKSSEREKYAYYSEFYRFEEVVLFVKKEKKDCYKLNKLEDIISNDFQLGTTRGFYYGQEYDKLKNEEDFNKHLQIVTYDFLHYKKLIHDRIDGFLGDLYAGSYGLKKNGYLEKVAIYPLKIYKDNIYFIFSKESVDKKVVADFNKSLNHLKKNGEIDQIISNYLQ